MDRRAFLKKIVPATAAIVTIPYLWPARNAFGWGAMRGFVPTHNNIVSAAIDSLEINAGVDLSKFPGKTGILAQDEVILRNNLTTYGTGPDVEGNSLYSYHYYNPITGQGRGPKAVAEFFGAFLMNMDGQVTQDSFFKQLAWAAHFLADMHVPYHVVGTSAQVAYGRRQNPTFNEDDTGPHWLYRDPKFGTEFIPEPGWGLYDDFSLALQNFMYYYPIGSKGDWFDPWYLNGWVPIGQSMKIFGGSHANWEADVGLYAGMDRVIPFLNRVQQEEGFFEPLWKNRRAEFGRGFYIPAQNMAYDLARQVALRTRNKIEICWKHHEVGIAYAIRSVYTMYRGLMTEMEPIINISNYKKGIYDIIVTVRNKSGFSEVTDVKGKLTIGGKSRIESLNGAIPIGGFAPLKWRYGSSKKERINATVEIIGTYTKCPDLGYLKHEFSFDADVSNPDPNPPSPPDSVPDSQLQPATPSQNPSAQWQGTWRVTSKWECHPGASVTWDFTVISSGSSCSVVIRGTTYPCQIRENWIEWKMINNSDNITLTFQKQGKTLTGRFEGTRKGYKGNICGSYIGRLVSRQ